MGAEHQLKDQARQQTRMLLAQSTSFLSLPFDQQRNLYREVYQASYDRLARRRYEALPPAVVAGDGLVRQTAVDPRDRRRSSRGNQPRYNPDDPTDPANFENRRIEQAGQLAGEFIESVNFPQFVRDLLLAVFRGNLEVQHQQTEDFIRLLKAATGSLGEFVRKVDDFEAYSRLAENEPERFQMALPAVPPEEDEDEDADEAGSGRTPPGTPTLLDRNGSPVDVSSGDIRAKILDTKIAMAQENRALLREVILLGVTRFVVNDATVETACVFDIKAKEKVTRTGIRQNEQVRTSGDTVGGGIYGLFSGGRSSTNRETEISVSSAAGRSSTDLAAKITGSVRLNMKTDYFKLDNFAEMYRQIAPPAPVAAPVAPSPAAPPAPLTAAP
ncbi:hypothetical protein [Streptomyces phaeochromogenes]|uniref:hypothetical protein n=1 Tax=Streptomyces phaeochromogenes TaxID=1923 RepID=UPI0036CF8DB1